MFVRALGFTHQQLAAPLFAVMNILDRIGDRRFDDSRTVATITGPATKAIGVLKSLFSTTICKQTGILR
jgi:hypothetical protein